MHPRNGPNASPQSPRYRAKLPQLRDALNGPQGLLPGAPMAVWMYKRINTRTQAQRDILRGHNQNGKAVFQYDPNGRGQGQPAWRLFYEEHVFNDSDPPPGPASALGIPDL